MYILWKNSVKALSVEESVTVLNYHTDSATVRNTDWNWFTTLLSTVYCILYYPEMSREVL